MLTSNSAIHINLSGQVCTASIGDRIYSECGGQADLTRGAGLAEGSKPIIPPPATALGGNAECFVTRLGKRAMVTLTHHMHYVVTEFVIAELYGKNLGHRAEALITINHLYSLDELHAFACEHHRV